MKLHINISEDKELRDAVLELVRGAVKTEIRAIMAEEAAKASEKAMENIEAWALARVNVSWVYRQTIDKLVNELHTKVLEATVDRLTKK